MNQKGVTMTTALVGYTGFVGSNIAAAHNFTHLYNSKNIDQAFDTNPDLLVFAGIRAEKYIANQEPEKDFAIVQEAFENIKKINPQRLVLISTIDVYPNPVGVDESDDIDPANLLPYGYNRLQLENWVRDVYPDAVIIRLPGLFGRNIKKNFIYDLIRIIPSALTPAKFQELSEKSPLLLQYYALDDHGFYKCRTLDASEETLLRDEFLRIGFTALNFTDSRGVFQFYPLHYLWDHIQIALEHQITTLNPATEPVSIREVYHYVMGQDFTNEIPNRPVPNYNYRTEYAEYFHGENGYLFSKERILQEIKTFVENSR